MAYRSKTLVNWCPKDKTVLANEQVIDGKCERCDTQVIQKEIEQWMFKITEYADRLVEDMEKLDWPSTTKLAQKNWIGKSEGTIVKFQIKNFLSVQAGKFQINVFTTRVDTIFGCTYVVVAPEHELLANNQLLISNINEVKKYISKAKNKSALQRTELNKEKTGVELKGIKAINPFNGEEIPIFVADYVLGNYGTGAVMAVPAHDERDFEFAKKYNLPIKPVIDPIDSKIGEDSIENPQNILNEVYDDKRCYEPDGMLINSEIFTGMMSAQARQRMTKWLEDRKLGEAKTNYRLHDWVLSRQRYWGVPIPVIKCEDCGYLPVSEKDLPIKLPKLDNFLPTDDGKSPLAKDKKWMSVKCPKCQKPAQRESDTMDTFVDSSWYFIRYTDPKNKNKFADAKKMKNWLPVPMYIGGAEHNTMHLLYSRFFTKALYDLKLVNFKEPFIGRRNHGIILGPDNQKMSKSRGNVVDPDKEVKNFGADSVRMYLGFMGPYEQGGPWDPTGILGVSRFLNRVWTLSQRICANKNKFNKIKDDEFDILTNQTIKKVGENIKELKFNTAISALMIFQKEMDSRNLFNIVNFESFLKILSPFAPFITEEIWRNVLGNKKSIFLEKWPKFKESKIKSAKVIIAVQINGKTRGTVQVSQGATREDVLAAIKSDKKLFSYVENDLIKKMIFVPDRIINLIV